MPDSWHGLRGFVMKMKAAKRLGCFLATVILMGSFLNSYAGAYGSSETTTVEENVASTELSEATRVKLDNIEKELTAARSALEKLVNAQNGLESVNNEELAASIAKKQAEIQKAEEEIIALLTSGDMTIEEETVPLAKTPEEPVEYKAEEPVLESEDELQILDDVAPLANFKEEKFGWQWVVGVVFFGVLTAEIYRRYIVRKHASAMETFFYEDK